MYNVYITECKNSNYTKLLRKEMCKNNQILCKSYHLLHAWGLIILNCLYYNSHQFIDKVDYVELVKLSIDIKSSDICIENFVDKQQLIFAHQLLSYAYKLRMQYYKYCNIKPDKSHVHFYKNVKETIKKLEKHLN